MELHAGLVCQSFARGFPAFTAADNIAYTTVAVLLMDLVTQVFISQFKIFSFSIFALIDSLTVRLPFTCASRNRQHDIVYTHTLYTIYIRLIAVAIYSLEL